MYLKNIIAVTVIASLALLLISYSLGAFNNNNTVGGNYRIIALPNINIINDKPTNNGSLMLAINTTPVKKILINGKITKKGSQNELIFSIINNKEINNPPIWQYKKIISDSEDINIVVENPKNDRNEPLYLNNENIIKINTNTFIPSIEIKNMTIKFIY